MKSLTLDIFGGHDWGTSLLIGMRFEGACGVRRTDARCPAVPWKGNDEDSKTLKRKWFD